MAELTTLRFGPTAGGAAQQLVVLLHGVGADGHDLIDLAPQWAQALPHALFVAPDGPEPYDMLPPGVPPHGRQWFSLADRAPARMLAGVANARASLDPFLDAELARAALPAGAYALMGFSQGAMTALYTGLRRATPPRAILAFSGALIAPERLEEVQSKPPVLVVHGEEDPVVPVDTSRAAERALRARGIPVESLFRPGLGHGIDAVGLSQGALLLQKVFSSKS